MVRFEQDFRAIIEAYGVEVSDLFAPAHPSVPEQPLIPYVLYKPASATAQSPKPLIIHTHGGPHVYIDKNKPHAEIAYYLSHGLVVACPNYRGSALYPNASKDPEEWLQWIERSKGKHHITGPEDVYAVTSFVRNFSFIKKDKVFLRGLSFGSHINSHLLTMIQKGRFENIYSGVQFAGGVKYPVPESMLNHFPMMIAHAVSDGIADFSDARLFMEKMLLKEMSTKQNKAQPNQVQTFVSYKGDHHLIDPELSCDDKSSDSYIELKRYIEMSTSFIHEIVQNHEFKAQDSSAQLQHLLQLEENISKIENVDQLVKVNSHLRSSQSISPEAVSSASSSSSSSSAAQEDEANFLSPTMAHLKLNLDSEYTGEPRIDLVNYLQKHFKPLEWEKPRHILEKAGDEMLKDSRFMEQLFAVIEQEKTFLASHPDHMVLYHAAENSALQLYSVITLWKKMLKGDFSNKLEVINEMRFFDFMSETFDNIDIFLHKMREKRRDEERRSRPQPAFSFEEDEEEDDVTVNPSPFNHLSGFAERALAWNPALTTNQHTTASCTLWWYFQSALKSTMVEAPYERVIGETLMALGINSKSRANRYLQLFDRTKHTLAHQGKNQGVLQQVFLPIPLADRTAYVCQIWGEEFKLAGSGMKLSRPSMLKAFRQNPQAFEAKLRHHSRAFSNYENDSNFGSDDFKYGNLPQVRYLFKNNSQTTIFSHFRYADQFQDFSLALMQIVKEDFADYIVRGTIIPRGVVQDAHAVRLKLEADLQLATHGSVAEGVLYLQQKELCDGLVENPRKELYADVVTASKKTKVSIQTQLGNLRFFSPRRVHLYALCRYLKGYTYYELLKEAADATFPGRSTDSAMIQRYNKENYEFLMLHIHKFTVPGAATTEYICGNDYLRLREIINNSIRKYEYDPQKNYEFFQMSGPEVFEETLFYNELNNAIEGFLVNARLSKEAGYGHDISEQQLRYY
ncbi:MAG: hypothetical protein P4M14_03125 [Gammaproteobacteria bacterium]|nr:hypothetical protein [Gammaproteobacteria bacterium]